MIAPRWNPFFRFPRVSLLLSLLLLLPVLLELRRFQVTSETRALLSGDERNLSSYEKVREVLAGTEVVLISLEHDDLFSAAGLDAVRRVSEAFEQQAGVGDVKSLTHSYQPVREGLSFRMIPFVPAGPLGGPELERLREFCRTHPLVRNLLVSADGRQTLITVTFTRPPASALEQRALRGLIETVLLRFRAEGLRFTVLALPFIEDEIRSTLVHDLRRFVPAAIVLLVAILWLTFRSLPILLLVLANQAAVLVLLPGLIQLSGYRLSVFSVMLFPMLTGIHLTLMAHLFTAFQRALSGGQAPASALEAAVIAVNKPAAFATVTTVIGLLSLAVGGLRPTAEFGQAGALGLALVHFMTFGPGLSVLKLSARWWRAPAAPPAADSSRTEPAAAVQPTRGTNADWPIRLAQATRRGRRAILGLAVLTFLAAALGVRQVRTDIRAVEFLDPRSPTRQAIERIDRAYGGINVVQIEFDTGHTNGVNDLAVLRYLEAVQRHAEAQPEFTGVYSYAQLLAMMNQIWEGGKPEALRLPDNPLLVQIFVFALRRYDFPFLTALADRAFRTGHLVLRTRDMPATRYLDLINGVVAFAETNRPPGVTVSAARGIHSILEADRRILRSQLGSAGLTLAVIGLVLTLLWRSIRLAAISMGVNVLPVAAVVGLAGYLRVPLNSITVMVGAISLGIAVDNSIHFITHWLTERRAGADPAEAIRRTLEAKGRPILWTDAILVAVFAVFWFSSFPPVVHFGLLSAAAFLGALAGVLLLLPALLVARTPNPCPGAGR